MKLRLSISLQVTLVFVLFAAALLTGAGMFAYNSGREALQAATTGDLLSVANEKQAALDDWIGERLLSVSVPSGLPHLLDDLAELTAAAPDSPRARAAHDHLVRDLKPRTGPGEEFLMLFVMDPETGKVLAATDSREEGKFKEDRAYFINGKSGPYVENPYNSLELRGPAMTVSAPLRSSDGRLLGVLAGHVNLDRINAIIGRRTGIHQSDDTFLVNTSNLLVTQPRSMADPALLRRGIHTEPVRRGLAGQSGTMLADDYRGVPVIAVYRWMPERRLCLIVKIDQAEAFAPSRVFGRTLALFGFLALLVASALAAVLARIGTRPILALRAGAASFGRGELDVRLPETARSELGDLAREFNHMAAAISEREAALGKWAHIFENAGWGVVATNIDGKTIGIMNPTFAKMYGCTAEELTGKPVLDIFAPEARAEVPEFIRLANEKEHHTFESKHIRKDGTVFPVLVAETAVKDAQGQVLYRVANIQDITERKRAEKELQALSSRNEAILASVPDIIVEVDNNKIYTWANRAGREFFGEGVIGKEAAFYFEGEQKIYDIVNPLFKGSEDVIYVESWQRRQDGEKRLLAWWFRVLKDAQGKVTGALSTARDITEGKLAEDEIRRLNAELEQRVAARTAQLEASNKELEAFSYSVSHDLRAPLRHISGYVDLLNKRFQEALPEKARHYLNEVTDSASQMGVLIDDLLQFSRTGRQELRRADMDMNAAVREVLEKLKAETKDRKISWNIEELPRVFGDDSLLRQVWINLLENAVKYTRNRDEAKIKVGFVREPDHLEFFVRDNGVGFDMQYAHKLFGVFERLHSPAQFEGTGIGLANVQRIIHKHGGRVRAEGWPDEGAAFYFTIPEKPFDEGGT